ncbi:YigZ family protein [Thiolinea disciformis]|uniref:YigZ family protein n=1 Tax=Thiolinea disciformis TaxID=125614 RepID=UPI000360B57D|nr:YigZ family protein [Thiolinea disciformis]
MNSFPIPAQTLHYEQTIKNSRFISYLAHAPSPELAHQIIDQYRLQYADARHVCWAFIAGQPRFTTAVSCSDDGEPAGTAGKPMLNVLQHGEVGEIVAVVIRYFGGIKLGTGGLVRAYSSSVAEAYKLLPTRLKVPIQRFQLNLAYPLEDVTRRMLASYGCAIESADYQTQLSLLCRGAQDQVQLFRKALQEVGRGQIELALFLE